MIVVDAYNKTHTSDSLAHKVVNGEVGIGNYYFKKKLRTKLITRNRKQ